jgi:hypothetical protein
MATSVVAGQRIAQPKRKLGKIDYTMGPQFGPGAYAPPALPRVPVVAAGALTAPYDPKKSKQYGRSPWRLNDIARDRTKRRKSQEAFAQRQAAAARAAAEAARPKPVGRSSSMTAGGGRSTATRMSNGSVAGSLGASGGIQYLGANGQAIGVPEGGGMAGFLSQADEAQMAANAANDARYNAILGGYDSRIGGVEGDLSKLGATERQAIEDRHVQSKAAADQDLLTRGLGDSTIRSSVMRGYDTEKDRSLTRLAEDQTRLRLEYLPALQGDRLSFMERRNDVAPDPMNYAQLGQNLGASGAADFAVPGATVPAKRTALRQTARDRAMANLAGRGITVKPGQRPTVAGLPAGRLTYPTRR